MGNKSKFILLIPMILVVIIVMSAIVTGVVMMVRSHRYVSAKGNSAYASEFADMQAKHIQAAKRLGFPSAPLNDKKSIRVTAGLTKVKSCKYFKVAEMKYASPYLTPVAKERLYQLSKEFSDACHAQGLPKARLIVTSMLRTENDVQELKKNNKNAVDHSAHMYGTTFDISWSYYQCLQKHVDGNEYLLVLAEILRKNREEGVIFVRYETAQQCFHITINK